MSDKRMLALLKKRKEELSAPSKPISLAAKPEVSRNEAKSIAPADKKARSSSNNGNDAVAKPLPSLSTVSSAAKRPAGSGQDAAAVPAGRNDKKRPAVGTVKAPVAENANAAARTRDITSATPPLKKGGLTALQAQMENKLQGAQFRWLNEKLYTTTSEEVRFSHYSTMSLPPQLSP
jgi:ribosomal RNA-processing protein 8